MWLVEPAQIDDIDAIYEIEQENFSSPWSKISFYEELKHHYSYLWVAKDTITREIAGFICFWIIWDEMHILNIAVRKSLQGRGIGSLLISEAFNYAVKKQVKWIRLEVRETNQKAISFYKKLGFKKVGRRRRYYFDTGEDAIIMELKF